MNVHGQHFRTIWLKEDDPRSSRSSTSGNCPLPSSSKTWARWTTWPLPSRTCTCAGEGLIGGRGLRHVHRGHHRRDPAGFDAFMQAAAAQLKATRPTAVNLEWGVDRQLAAMAAAGDDVEAKIDAALRTAQEIADEDADFCRRIGEHGVRLIEEISKRKGGEPVNVLTHCNAGWLAFVDYGTATGRSTPHDRGIPVHVWVDETRPRNQGAPHRLGTGRARRAPHDHP
ncbi:MAG: hypothetical protein R3A10_18985 [Caldilineaceae bacterium]